MNGDLTVRVLVVLPVSLVLCVVAAFGTLVEGIQALRGEFVSAISTMAVSMAAILGATLLITRNGRESTAENDNA